MKTVKYISEVVSFKQACEVAKSAAVAGLKGVTVQHVAGGYRAAQVVKAWVESDKSLGGSISRERQEAAEKLMAKWELEQLDPSDEKMSERDWERANSLNADALGKKTRHARSFDSWYEAREFQRKLEAQGLKTERDQNYLEWWTYNGFQNGRAVAEWIQAQS